MTRTLAASLLLLILAAIPAAAQFSGFMSAGYGYNSNPLYNYEELSDQVRQSYLELGYVHQMPAARLQAVYVGGLTLFNRFEGRNYYEHSLAGHYLATLSAIPAREDEEEYTADDPFSSPDSSDTELGIDLRLGARHDKAEYEVFDNFKELDAGDEELTRTRKVRRVFVEDRYREVIAALYGDAPEVRIDTTIKFQDGKVSQIRTTLIVRRLELGRTA